MGEGRVATQPCSAWLEQQTSLREFRTWLVSKDRRTERTGSE